MPRKKNNKRKGRKGDGNLVVAQPSGFSTMVGLGRLVPSRLKVKMAWSYPYVNSVFSAGSFQLYQYRLNSIYDPDYTTGIGDLSAWGYTEAAALYKYYRVDVASYRIELTTLSANAYVFVAFPSNDTSVAAGDTQLWPAWPYSKMQVVGGDTGSSRATIRHRLDLATFTGARNFKSSENFSSLMGVNPVDVVYLNVGVYNVNPSRAAAAGDLAWTPVFTFEVELWEQTDNISQLLRDARRVLAAPAAPPPKVSMVRPPSGL